MRYRLRYWLWLLSGLLAGCQAARRPAPPAIAVAPAARPWAATIAERLYERHLVSAAGRDSLQRRIDGHALSFNYSVPGYGSRYYADTLTDPATVLAYCSELFQREFYYRLDMGRGISPLTDSAAAQLQLRFEAALSGTRGDSAAALRQLASPPQLIEYRIKAEDSLSRLGWTLYPPLHRLPATAPPGIAESRSVMGRTRTRTARDYYELGLVDKAQYAVLRGELATGRLVDEVRLTQRAAQLALETASYPARLLAYDSLLNRLTLSGVLLPASRQRLLTDSLARRSLSLFAIVPYCAHARVLTLDSLPAAPSLRYQRLLATVAGLGPDFRYSAARVRLRERRGNGSRYQQATISFEAGERHYAITIELDAMPDAPDRADAPPTVIGYVPDELAALLNQCLRDQGRPTRLYLAASINTIGQEDNRIGLLLLTPAQRTAWGPALTLLDGPPSPDTLFTSQRIERALGLYQRLGLLAGLSAAEVAAGRQQALSGTVDSYVALLRCFPRLVVDTGGEDAEEPGAYAHAIRQVAAACRGAFHPTRIHDSFTGQEAEAQRSSLSFVSAGRTYRATLTSDLGWMINDFTKLLQRAVRETTNGQLYYLGWGDESGGYLFLTNAQAAALRRAQPALFREQNAEAARPRQ